MAQPPPPPPARPSPRGTRQEEQEEEEEEEEEEGGGAPGSPTGAREQRAVYRPGSRRCGRCLITFPDAAFAARHAKRQHPRDFAAAALRGALFVCFVCARPFRSSPALLRHQRGHAPETPPPPRGAPLPAKNAPLPAKNAPPLGKGRLPGQATPLPAKLPGQTPPLPENRKRPVRATPLPVKQELPVRHKRRLPGQDTPLPANQEVPGPAAPRPVKRGFPAVATPLPAAAPPPLACSECGRAFAREGALHRHYIRHARGEL